MTKQALCQYSDALDFEGARGALRIWLPTQLGYINYNLTHTVKESIHADIWRLGQAYAADDARANEYALTPAGAEWDMAIRIAGRDDFIGGYAHGDEIFSSLSLWLDGQPTEVTSLSEPTPFRELRIREDSVGYDPADHTTAVLLHQKDYRIDRDGITLSQRVEWLSDHTLGPAYLAMMPPMKTWTDTYFTDVDESPAPLTGESFSVAGCRRAVFYSTSNGCLRFEMSVPRYPSLAGGDTFLMTDNGGKRYHKMYFMLCKNTDVRRGDVWETETVYRISNG